MSEHTEAPGQAEQPQSEQPEQPVEQHEHHPAKQSSGSSGTFLAILLAIVAVVAVFLLWQKQQAMHKDTQVLQQSIGKLLTMVEQNHETQMQEIAGHRHPATEAQLERTAALVQDLRGRLGQEQLEWFIAEMEYLLRTASHRLTLEHDSETALAALAQARQRLAGQDPGFQPVIQQIDKDIANISAVSLPDRNRIAAEITTIMAAAEHWPFAVRQDQAVPQTPPEQPEPEEQATEESGIQRMLGRVWEDLKGLVTIRRNGEVARPLLQPQQRYFLQQNLQLKLQTARLALLGGNDAAFRDSLTEAGEWITRYFDTSSLPVGEARSSIEQLAAIDLSPELPTLGNSIALLHQAAMKIRPQAVMQPEPAIPGPTEQVMEKESGQSTKTTPSAPAKPNGSPDPAATDTPATLPSVQQKKDGVTPPGDSSADTPKPPQGNEQ